MHHDRLKHTTKIWGQGLRPSSVWCKRHTKTNNKNENDCHQHVHFWKKEKRKGCYLRCWSSESGLDFSRAFDLHWLSCDPENSSFCSSLAQFLLRMITQKWSYSFVTFGLWLPDINHWNMLLQEGLCSDFQGVLMQILMSLYHCGDLAIKV